MADPRGTSGPLRMLGRAGRGRLAPAAGGLRAVQQAVLRSFAATGNPPPAEVLQETATAFGATAQAAGDDIGLHYQGHAGCQGEIGHLQRLPGAGTTGGR